MYSGRFVIGCNISKEGMGLYLGVSMSTSEYTWEEENMVVEELGYSFLLSLYHSPINITRRELWPTDRIFKNMISK